MERATNGRLAAARHHSRARVVGVHSFRGGAGKTTLAANLGFLLARAGAQVAVADVDLQAPALHIVFGVDERRILHSVSEFVKGQCEIDEVPMDLTRELDLEAHGTLHFLPANPELHTVTSILFDGYDVAGLNEHLHGLAERLALDFLVLDTHHGINRETLLSLATSDTVLVLLRPDGQDRQGASVLVHVAEKVGVPSCLLVPNMIRGADRAELSVKLEQDLKASVAGVLPYCGELSGCACAGLFAARQPDDPFTAELERIARQLLPAEVSAVGPA